MDIGHEAPRNANDPNRGLNVKVFLLIVAVAVVVIAIVLAFGVHTGDKVVPTPTKTTSPTSSLAVPHIIHTKPSPLHSGLQASVKSKRLPGMQVNAGQ
ncbi:MAG: hypothetical protein JWM43_705 [Acidobacteriaceae bacterium]|jgi:hypothetical protein|nr:hypothetical protein [Acidobacteriaceae bacterium]